MARSKNKTKKRWPKREVDLGHNHWLDYYGWAPDDLPENRARYGTPLPRVKKAGAIISHLKPDGSECFAGIHFDLPETKQLEGARWQVVSWEPLTLTPSLLCLTCKDHGFIREGRWVPA
jgi:hypothetical protein